MTMPDPKDGAEPAGAWAQSAKLAFRFLFLAVCLAAMRYTPAATGLLREGAALVIPILLSLATYFAVAVSASLPR